MRSANTERSYSQKRTSCGEGKAHAHLTLLQNYFGKFFGLFFRRRFSSTNNQPHVMADDEQILEIFEVY